MVKSIVQTLAFIFSFGASAESVPDVLCRSANVADRGYVVQLLRSPTGSYTGHLRQISFFGEEAKYSGEIVIESETSEAGCALKISGASNAFSLQIVDVGDGQLINIYGEQVGNIEKVMNCLTSPAFNEDARRICEK